MKNRKAIGAGLAIIAVFAFIAVVTLRSEAPAYGDDQCRTTSFSVQTGWSWEGASDIVASFTSTDAQDARMVCEIRYVEPGSSVEETTFRSPSKRGTTLLQDDCGITTSEFPGCMMRAYWTVYDSADQVTWTFMRELQLP